MRYKPQDKRSVPGVRTPRNAALILGLAEKTMLTGETTIRVRYAETDRMGLLHHANYLVYFEEGRTELLRSQGFTYRDIEDQGFYLVLTKVQVRYKSPAYYDDLLTLRTIVQRTTLVKIEHRYELMRGDALLAEGETTLGCVDHQGRVQPLPETLRLGEEIDK
jgi:acyl-CoA thioester hydrolase